MASRKKKENTQQIGTYRKKKEQLDNSIGSYRNKLRQNYNKYMELLKANQENQRNEYYQQMNQQAGQDLLRTAAKATGTQPKQTVTLDNVKQQAAKQAQQKAASSIQGTGYQPAKQEPQQDNLMSRVLQVKKQEDAELDKWNKFVLNSGAIGQSGISGAQAKAYTPTQTTADILKTAAKDIKADRQAKKIKDDDVLLRAAAKDYAAQNPNGPETATWGQVKKGSQLEEVLSALKGQEEKKTQPEVKAEAKVKPFDESQPAQMKPEEELPTTDKVLRDAMIRENRNGTGNYAAVDPRNNRTTIGQASQATAYNALGVKTPAMRQAEQIQKQASRVKELDDLVTGNVEHGTIHSARPENVSNMLTETNARASRSEIEILRHKGYYDNDNFDPEWWSQSYREQKLDEYNEDALQRQANIEELQAQIDAGGVTQSVVEPLLSLYTNDRVENERKIIEGEGYTEEEKANAEKVLDNLYRSVGINGQSAKDRAMHLYSLISPQEDLNTDNVRRMAYDEMNGLGSYERAIKSLKTYEEKKAFNDRIDQAIDGIVNPESNLDYQLRNEQAWLEYDNSQIERILNQNGWEESYNDMMSEPVTGDTEYHPELNLVNDPMSYFDKGTSTTAGNADYVYSVLGGGLKNTDIVAGDFHKAALMNPKERDKFISLYNDGKKAEAWAFYQGIEPMLNQLYAQYEELSMQDTASRYPILSSAVSLINTALQPAEMILNIPNYARSLMGIQNTTMDPNSAAYLNTRMKSTIRQTISKDLGDTWGKVYNGLMSGADSSLNFAIARALGLPDNLLQAGTLMLFSSQAFETSLQQNMKNNKGNYAYNMVEAALDAIIETGTEIATVERFMMNPTNLMRFTVRAITSEPAEEFTGALVEPYIKELAKHRNQYKDRAVQILGNHGYWNEQGSWVEVKDIDKATRQAMHEWNRDACLAAQEALVSVIPMIGFQGGRIAMSNIRTGRAITGDTTTAEERVERLMGAAESMGPESDSGKLAARIRSREASGKKASNYQLGQLASDTMREATEQGSPEKVLSVLEAVEPKQAKEIREDLHLATEREIEDAEGERVKGPRGVIYNAEDGRSVHARLVGVTEIERQDDDGKKVKAPGVIIEVDGKQIPVDAAKVLTTSMETGELLRNARENPVFDAGYTYLVLSEMEAGREGNPTILTAPAEAIRLAAYMGRKMPTTGISEETAKKLYDYSVREKEELRKKEVQKSTTRGKGKGTATFKGLQYGTEEYKKALKDAGLSKETRNRMGAWAEVARVAGIDLVFMDNAEIEAEKKKGNIGFSNEARGLYGSQSGNRIMLNIEAETTEKDENGKVQFTGRKRNIGVAFGHEFIHWLQGHSYEAYNALEKYVLEEQSKALRKEGKYLSNELKRIALSQGTDLMGAISELVADSCDQIMLNEDVLEHLQETNKGLYEQFKGFVKDLAARIRAATSELGLNSSSAAGRMIHANMKELARLVNLAYDEATGQVTEAQPAQAEAETTTADYVTAEYVGTGETRTVQARITNPLTMKQGQFSWMPNQTAQSLLDSKEISLTPAQEAELRKVTEYGYEKIEDAWDAVADVLQELGYDGIRMDDGQYIALKNTQTAEEGETRLSQAEHKKTFAEQIDDFMDPKVDNEKVFGSNSLVVSRAPKTFEMIGLPKLPVIINQEHVGFALLGKYKNEQYKEGHEFSQDEFKKLPDKIAHPIAIAYDPSSTKELIIYVDMINKTGDQVIVPLRIGGRGSVNNQRIDALKIDTVYARKDGRKMLESAIKNNSKEHPTLFYIDKEKAAGLWLGQDTKTILRGLNTGLIHRITDSNSPVKIGIKDQTDTIQFKRWFGESKVVNDDGTPMIVYHGTSELFDAFDISKGRANMDIQGAFFSPWVEDAEGYGENVGAYYLSIQNPANEQVAYAALNKFKGQNNAGVKARNYLISLGYDGVINGVEGQPEEFIAFRPEQIKSATENIGTFDRTDSEYRYSMAEMDAEYEQAVEDKDTEKQEQMVKAAAQKAGYTKKVYHGTPYGGFTQFRDWSYFTENKEYADRYNHPSQSSTRGYYSDTQNPMTYALYMNPGRVFDTRDPETAKVYEQFRQEYGLGQLTENGLPDWTDGRDIIDFIEENNLPYDTIILNEGADGGYGAPVVSRGVSYVTRSNMVKSAEPVTYDDNGKVIPLSERFNQEKTDIRYSQAETTDPKQEELYNALEEANAKVKALRERVRAMKPEVDAWTERITEAFDNGTFDQIQEEYKEWEKGYVQLREELTEAERAYRQANQDFEDYIEQRDVAQEKAEIEKSGLTEAEYRRKQAVKTFGTTSDFNEAGYLMPDGKMLDFSGKKHGGQRGTRSEDHRAIGQIYASSQKQGGEAMLSFMRDGNIRVMASTPGIDMISTIEPTAEQYSQIRKMAQRFAGEEYFNIDFTDENGQVVDTLEYDGRVNPERIINDIKTFYKTGSAPQQSVVSQFHYSQADMNDIDVETWMETRTPGSFRTEDERIMWQTWKKLRNDVRMVNFRIEEYKKQIRALEAKGENMTAEERDQLRGLRNKLEVKQVQLDRLEKELRKTTSTEGFATMMRNANLVIGDFMAGKTQEQVTAAVDTMTNEVERAEKEIAKQEKELQKLGQESAVKTVRAALRSRGMNTAVNALRSQYGTTMSQDELEGRLAEIILKSLKGEDVTADIEALANDVVTRQAGYGSVEAEEALSALRGKTIVIGPGQQAEMKANHITLKDLQKRIKGSGIKLVYGESSTLDTNAEELEAEVPALKGMLNNEKASLENFVEYVENLLSLKNSNAEESGYDVKEVESFIGAMAQIMLNENAGGMSKADLIAKIKAEAGRIGTALNAVRRIRESLGTVRESGAKAQTWTGVLGQDLDQVLDYYDQVARMAARQERTQVRKTLVEQLKAENTKKLMQQQEKYEQMMKNERTARQLANDNMTLRSKINTVVKRISRLMTEETDLKNIPEEAKPLARLLVKMFVEHDSNYRRVTFSDNKQLQRAAENIRGWEKLFGGFDYDHGLDWLVTGEGDTADTELRDAVEEALVDIETGLMEYRNAEGRGTVSLQDRKNALTKIQDAVAKIYNVIQARRYVEIDGKRALTAELAASARDDMQHSRFRGEWTGWLGRRIGTARRGVIYGNMTPVYFFKNLRNGTLSSLFRGYESAENKNGLAIARAQATMQKIAQETGYGTWDQERRYEIQLEKGGTVRLTLGEMMSLYATWQREMMNQLEENGPTKSFHLTLGGFITEPEQRGGVAGRQMQQQRPHRLTEGDMAKITAMMTPQQIEYVTRVVEYMTKEIGELGNEASMKMYGIRKFNEKWYFPFEVWRGVMSSKSTAGVQNAQQNAAAHQSFTKRRTNNARNALMIRDFTQTAARHIVAQINYNTFAPAIEWMQRVMNSKQMEGEDAESMTERNLWAMFQEVYGKDAYAYFKRFQQDMNGGATQQSKTFYDRLISTFRKSAVAGSLSVAAQQPLSYIRAAMEINPRWLVEALNPRYYAGSNAEMEKWSGVAVLKRMGKFDMGFGESAAQYIEPEARERGLRRAYNTVSDWTTALPELMDRVTWTRMWTAAKLEQVHLHPEMDPNSDEFMELVANRFNDIIRRTQVYDSTLVRSQNMRDKNPGLKMLTSFMAEPTLTANVLADAIINARENGGMRRLATAAATYMLSAVAQAAVKGTMGAGRNPDKKKTWEENWWYRFLYNFIGEANPISLIPGYSNIVSLLKDGELDDNAMAMIGKVFDAAKTGYQLVSGKSDDVYRSVEDSAALITQLFTNIPAKNMMRDLRAMINFFTQPYAQRETSQGVLRYQAQDLLMAGPELLGAINSWLGKEGYQTTVDAYAQRIYQAQKSGDEEAARMMSEYVTLAKSGAEDPEKALQSKLKSIAKKDKDASAEETMQYLQENGGSEQSVSTYIMDELKDGKIDAEEARKLLKQNEPDKSEDDIWWKVDRAEYAKENGTDTPGGYYYRLTDAVESNRAEEINKAVNDLKKHGVTDKQIKTKLSSWKQAYLDASGDEKRRIRDALTKAYKAIGLTAEEAGKIIDGWKKK